MKTAITHWLYMALDYARHPNGEYDFCKEKVWQPEVYHYKADDDTDTVFIRSISIDVDIPDDFDPTARQIAALEERKRKATKAYMDMVADLNQQISKLQAITFTEAS